MYDDSQRRQQRADGARQHPIRARILDLYAQDEGRSLGVKDLCDDLGDDADCQTVAYHVAVLRDRGLLPG